MGLAFGQPACIAPVGEGVPAPSSLRRQPAVPAPVPVTSFPMVGLGGFAAASNPAAAGSSSKKRSSDAAPASAESQPKRPDTHQFTIKGLEITAGLEGVRLGVTAAVRVCIDEGRNRGGEKPPA